MTEQEILRRLDNSPLPSWEQLPDFGLYMDQLITFVEKCFSPGGFSAGLTKAMVNNYVKNGLVSRPTGKTYSRESIAQLLMICVLKQTTSLDVMNQLLHPRGGSNTAAMYEYFLQEQRALIDMAHQESLVNPLSFALKAGNSQLICRMLLEDGD